MKSQKIFKKSNSYHFIGVGGVSMSALANYLFAQKKTVSGSDLAENVHFSKLKERGLSVYLGSNENYVKNADVVVYSSAVKDNDIELSSATRLGKPVLKRSQLLGEIVSSFSRSIGVSGSHGKTTATAMIAHALINSGINPTVFLGGEDYSFGNFLMGNCDVCVSEVCEYQKNILDVKPKIAVVLNVDNDHMDSYGGMDDMVNTFSEYIKGGIAVLNADDKYTNRLSHSSTVTFGIDNLANYSASGITEKNGAYSFTAKAYGRKLGRVNLKVKGRHNIYNALSAICVCDMLGVHFNTVKKALENFCGVKRRMERVGEIRRMQVVCDYAHHPKEIMATLKAILSVDLQTVIFQPHTYSRTELLMDEFCKALLPVKNLVIFKTYPARENFNKKGDGQALVERLKTLGKKDCKYIDTEKELETYLIENGKESKTALVLGAGDVYDVVKRFVN